MAMFVLPADEEVLGGRPQDVREEIVSINTDARPLALQAQTPVPPGEAAAAA
jgi:hypothetical protein